MTDGRGIKDSEVAGLLGVLGLDAYTHDKLVAKDEGEEDIPPPPHPELPLLPGGGARSALEYTMVSPSRSGRGQGGSSSRGRDDLARPRSIEKGLQSLAQPQHLIKEPVTGTGSLLARQVREGGEGGVEQAATGVTVRAGVVGAQAGLGARGVRSNAERAGASLPPLVPVQGWQGSGSFGTAAGAEASAASLISFDGEGLERVDGSDTAGSKGSAPVPPPATKKRRQMGLGL
ncbi:unnamed protein product, partial [Discosporangium mesarthrocarpum]